MRAAPDGLGVVQGQRVRLRGARCHVPLPSGFHGGDEPGGGGGRGGDLLRVLSGPGGVGEVGQRRLRLASQGGIDLGEVAQQPLLVAVVTLHVEAVEADLVPVRGGGVVVVDPLDQVGRFAGAVEVEPERLRRVLRAALAAHDIVAGHGRTAEVGLDGDGAEAVVAHELLDDQQPRLDELLVAVGGLTDADHAGGRGVGERRPVEGNHVAGCHPGGVHSPAAGRRQRGQAAQGDGRKLAERPDPHAGPPWTTAATGGRRSALAPRWSCSIMDRFHRRRGRLVIGPRSRAGGRRDSRLGPDVDPGPG